MFDLYNILYNSMNILYYWCQTVQIDLLKICQNKVLKQQTTED